MHWYNVFLFIYQMFKNVISVTYEIALDTGIGIGISAALYHTLDMHSQCNIQIRDL